MLRDRIKPLIPKIISRELTNRTVAAELGVAEESVCRILRQMKVVREEAPNNQVKSQATKALNEARRAYRSVVANTLGIKEAATAANCSTRTIYRLRKMTLKNNKLQQTAAENAHEKAKRKDGAAQLRAHEALLRMQATHKKRHAK